ELGCFQIVPRAFQIKSTCAFQIICVRAGVPVPPAAHEPSLLFAAADEGRRHDGGRVALLRRHHQHSATSFFGERAREVIRGLIGDRLDACMEGWTGRLVAFVGVAVAARPGHSGGVEGVPVSVQSKRKRR
ncbi:unnamed protein product, partial [Ectocarpus fasciculatus]